ncbi:MAG: SMC-Scp complex subunit ScpB [Terracidiphilus sp.]|jgi:segregation and condensation protein B
MSLKAKLEAVIYAAEEPVTLAQLAVLFAADAFEWKAQQETASAEQAAEDASETSQPLGLIENAPMGNGEFAYLELEPDQADSVAPEQASEPTEEAAEAVPEAGLETAPETSSEPDAEAAASEVDDVAAVEDPVPAGDAAAAAEAEARRQARLRDREARAIIRQLLDELIAFYASDSRGVEIREIAGGYRMATKPECHDAVRLFVRSLKPALKLSLPALETLAVIAYKQPVTAPEVNEIRGVDSSGVFGSLLARKLIATAGRKPVIGRPILYKTTREFLLRFGLKDVSELPSMEEFEKLAAIELEEPELADGAKSAQKPNRALGPEFDEAASEELEDSPAIPAESTPAEAAPDAPSPPEQAETESFPHDA